ncbi:hypothetical protein FRC06_011032 [Ceratobasidium sp. 370]|nr:hypothetical protein FRC06_011032 [Ceratobasidium sp. 370]
MHRLFVTQELVAAICARLYAEFLLERYPNSKRFRGTALVSTHFFHGMLPYIWGSVKLADLFRRRLIPVEILVGRNRSQVHISQSVSHETMSRFHFYAPYIKVLEVSDELYTPEIHNWGPLVEYSKDNKLLPNLAEITCEKFDPDALSPLLPSTRKLTIDPTYAQKRLDMTETQRILEHTANLCPGLRSLEFYPRTTKTTKTPALSQTFASLSSFKDLRRLASTPAVIQSNALQLVARLPRLDTLSIRSCGNGRRWDSSLCEKVSPGGFPALTDLTLHLDTPGDATRFWELVPLGKLKKLDLTLLARDDESPFISTICTASPRITKLGLKFVDSKKWSQWFYKISADMFKYLARLPLESYSFDRAKFDFEDAWARVAGAWRNLRSIKCLIQSTKLEDLVFLSSTLPKLEAIECDLDLHHALDAVETYWSPVGQPSFYPQLRHLAFNQPDIAGIMQYDLEGEERTAEFRYLARFLAYSWPKLSMVAVEDQEGEESGLGKDYYQTRYELKASQKASFNLFKELVLSYVKIYHGA